MSKTNIKKTVLIVVVSIKSFMCYTQNNNIFEILDLKEIGNDITCTTISSDGNLYVGSSRGKIAVVKGKKINIIETSVVELKGGFVSNIAVDSHNKLWVFSSTRGISQFDGSAWLHYSGPDSSFCTLKISNICLIDSYLNIGMKNFEGMLSINVNDFFKTKEYQIEQKKFNEGLKIPEGYEKPNTIKAIKYNSKSVWFITSLNGLISTSFDSGKWSYFPHRNFNDAVFPSALELDKNGNVWVGVTDMLTYEKSGLYMFDGYRWDEKIFKVQARINDLIIDKNNTKWLSTSEGLMRFDGKELQKINAPGNMEKSVLKVIIDNNNNKWIVKEPSGYIDQIVIYNENGVKFK